MDRIINVKVSGNHLTKDSNNAGTRGEANATILRITFDEGWSGYSKTIVFIDAYGKNPTKLTMTADLLENRAESTLIYLVPIPKEPLRIAGDMTFSIEGWTNGKRQRSVSDTLEVQDGIITDDIDEPTPTQIEQMQNQYEAIMDDIQKTAGYKNTAKTYAGIAENAMKGAIQAKESAEKTAVDVSVRAEMAEGTMELLSRRAASHAVAAEISAKSAEKNANQAENAVGKTSYIGENGNWYAWDGKKEEFYDTGIRAQAGSEVYVGDNPPASADVWLNPDGDYSGIIPHPDWSQNDPSKWNYIKNRPFYDEVIETSDSVTLRVVRGEDETTATIIGREGLGLIHGQKYRLTFRSYLDGVLQEEYVSPNDTSEAVFALIPFGVQIKYDDERVGFRVYDETATEAALYHAESGEVTKTKVNNVFLVGIGSDCDYVDVTIEGKFSYLITHQFNGKHIKDGTVSHTKLGSGVSGFILNKMRDYHVPSTIARVADVDEKIKDNRLAYEEKELIGSASNPPSISFNDKVSIGDTVYVELTTAGGTTYNDTVVVPDGVMDLFDGMACITTFNAFGNNETDTITVTKVVTKTIEDKFIPDTIARKTDIEDVKTTILQNDTDVLPPTTQADSIWTEKQDYYPSTAGWSYGDTFVSYYLVADKDFEIYWKNIPSTYLAIALYKNGEVTSANYKIRLTTSDNNLPTEDNRLSVTTGEVVVIGVWKSTSAFEAYIDYHTVYLSKNVVLQKEHVEQILGNTIKKKPVLRYVSGSGIDSSTERLEVYIPSNIGYVMYSFVHSVNESINCDVWRTGRAYACDDNLENAYSLTTTGEWECAVKLKDRSDFSGGVAHGDMVSNGIIIFADGKVINTESMDSDIVFSELKVVQSSNLYDPNDNSTVIAEHGSEHIFNVDGLTVKQYLKWLITDTITQCYLAMFPILKSVTSHIYTDTDFQVQEISSYPCVKKKAKELNIFSEESGVTAKFSIKDYPIEYTGGNQLLIHDNGGGAYNKCYYCISYSTENDITSGTVWKTQTHYGLTVVEAKQK